MKGHFLMKLKMLAAFLTVITLLGVMFLLTGGDAEAKPPIRSVSDVVDGTPKNPGDGVHTGFGPVHGASILLRDKNGISYSFETTGLPQGAYSNWLFVFNNRDGCHHPRPELGGQCGILDTKAHVDGVHTSPETNVDWKGGPAQGGVMWATGGVVGMDGVSDFQATLEKKNPPGPVLRGPGLTKPEKAEIQIIARHHGLLILGPLPEDGMVEELIGEVNGGCPPRMCVSLRDNVHPAP